MSSWIIGRGEWNSLVCILAGGDESVDGLVNDGLVSRVLIMDGEWISLVCILPEMDVSVD